MTVLFLLALIAVAGIFQSLVLNHGLDNMGYDINLSAKIVEPDAPFDIITTVENRKFLPVLFLQLSEIYPLSVNVKTMGTDVSTMEMANTNSHFTRVNQTMYLLSHQKLVRTLEASIPQRGVYRFGSPTLTSGDILGLKDNSEKFYLERELVVMPKTSDPGALPDTFGNFLGEMSVRRFILEDPVLTLSFREYTGREPQRDISWPRSLRDGKLMVKQYDYTMELSATVIVNCEFPGEHDPQLFEKTLSLARGVCEMLEDKKVSYNFKTNFISAGTFDQWASIGDGLGRGHLSAILEGLGRALPHTSRSFPELMALAVNRSESGRAHVLVTPVMTGEMGVFVSKAEHMLGSKIFVVDASKEVAGC